VTHGFVLHCDPRRSDNLQVVDHYINESFHLQELWSAHCSDDPGIEPNPPDALFDTITGVGFGRCRQPARDCVVYFTFTDGGEPGGCVRDTADIQVFDDDGLVISVTGDVDCGNHQAHSH